MTTNIFAPSARDALLEAEVEASRLHSDYVGTEHVLLALLRQTDGIATRTISALGVDPQAIAAAVEFTTLKAVARPRATIGAYRSPQSQRVAELALIEARALRHSHVGGEHLLLGLLRDHHGNGARFLDEAGIQFIAARDMVLRLLET